MGLADGERKAAAPPRGRKSVGDASVLQPWGLCHDNEQPPTQVAYTSKHLFLYHVTRRGWIGHSPARGCGPMLSQLLGSSCPGTQASGASPPATCSLVAESGKHERLSHHSLSCPCCSEMAMARLLVFHWPKQVTFPKECVIGKEEANT